MTGYLDRLRRAIAGLLSHFVFRRWSIEQIQDALAEREERLKVILENLPGFVAQLDNQGNLIYANQPVSGYSGVDLVGLRLEQWVAPEHREVVEQAFQAALRTGQKQEYEHSDQDPDGPKRHFLNRMAPLIRHGQVESVLIISTDITLVKAAEEQMRLGNIALEARVRERTAQLEATNQELEAFNYSISHDLQAPLRSLDGFSQALSEGYQSLFDETALYYLDRIRASAQRMGQLIDDLLRLSRQTRGELVRQSVDLSGAAQTIFEELKQSASDRQIDFRVDPNLTAWADPRLARVLLENLIGNAVKFTALKSPALIEMGSLPPAPSGSPEPIFYLRDNGIGFDMALADRLFVAFQRLHSDQEFPGSGIGLATVQRIINRHGGRVWAESQPGQGSTFYFTFGAL